MEDDAKTANKNLSLLRERYLSLSGEYQALQRKYDELLQSASGAPEPSSPSLSSPSSSSASLLGAGQRSKFASDILCGVQGLAKNPRYSDLVLVLSDGQRLKVHKNILSWRSSRFAEWDLEGKEEVAFDDKVPPAVAAAFVRFLYLDGAELPNEDPFLVSLMLLASEHGLPKLTSMCEMRLVGLVHLRNVAHLFRHAEDLKLPSLRSICLQTILNEFDAMKREDLDSLGSNLLAEIYRGKFSFPLHRAVEHGRDDVVFILLLLPEVKARLDSVDDHGRTPLRTGLDSKHYRICATLLDSGCNANAVDEEGRGVLHQMVLQEDLESVNFLVQKGASVNIVDVLKESPLHLAAHRGLAEIASSLLRAGAHPNLQNKEGRTALHLATARGDRTLIDLLLEQPKIDLNVMDRGFSSPLWLALMAHSEELATIFCEKGADLEQVDGDGNTLLHRAIDCKDLFATQFLISQGVDLNRCNRAKQTPLHRAALAGLEGIVQVLLHGEGMEPNARDEMGQAAIHLAVRSMKPRILELLLDSNEVNVDIVDHNGVSPLWEALTTKQHETVGKILIDRGANVGAFDRGGNSLLHNTIVQGLLEGALFLLRNRAPIDDINPAHQSCLELAIAQNQPKVIHELCTARSVDPNAPFKSGKIPLEIGFECKLIESCNSLVECGANVNALLYQIPLLSVVLSRRDEFAALFLIQKGAKINGEPGSSSPLHVASMEGLTAIMEALLQRGADPNAQDSEGLTPLHLAILKDQPLAVEILLKHPQTNTGLLDNQRRSPYRVAFEERNERIAKILARHSKQFSTELDDKGVTMLYASVGKKDGGDEEAVRFLISLQVKITTTGPQEETALHLAARLGRSKMCSLLLEYDASCVNVRNKKGQTALHLAAGNRDLVLTSLFIKCGAGPVQDNEGNTALHLTFQTQEKEKKKKNQNVEVARLLIDLAPTFVKMRNIKGETALHNLCQNGGDSSLVDILLDHGIDVNQQDGEGNTPMILGYLGNHEDVCVALMKRGAALWMTNNERICVLDEVLEEIEQLYPGRVALQRKLLSMITTKPTWLETPICQFCLVKFNVTIRRHHCRHCGRSGCSTCLPQTRKHPIPKFGITKAERLCAPCYDVLSNS